MRASTVHAHLPRALIASRLSSVFPRLHISLSRLAHTHAHAHMHISSHVCVCLSCASTPVAAHLSPIAAHRSRAAHFSRAARMHARAPHTLSDPQPRRVPSRVSHVTQVQGVIVYRCSGNREYARIRHPAKLRGRASTPPPPPPNAHKLVHARWHLSKRAHGDGASFALVAPTELTPLSSSWSWGWRAAIAHSAVFVFHAAAHSQLAAVFVVVITPRGLIIAHLGEELVLQLTSRRERKLAS